MKMSYEECTMPNKVLLGLLLLHCVIRLQEDWIIPVRSYIHRGLVLLRHFLQWGVLKSL